MSDAAREAGHVPHQESEKAFFEQMATCRDAYRRLADCIADAVDGQPTAIDIGCGLGAVGARLVERGWAAVGTELSVVAREMSRERFTMLELDLREPPSAPRLADVVICTETAEHVDDRFADNVVANIASRARRTIVFSAAQPGQDWSGHVNMKPLAYWLGKFADRGWCESPGPTQRLRFLMRQRHAQHEYVADNFVVLERLERGAA